VVFSARRARVFFAAPLRGLRFWTQDEDGVVPHWCKNFNRASFIAYKEVMPKDEYGLDEHSLRKGDRDY